MVQPTANISYWVISMRGFPFGMAQILLRNYRSSLGFTGSGPYDKTPPIFCEGTGREIHHAAAHLWVTDMFLGLRLSGLSHVPRVPRGEVLALGFFGVAESISWVVFVRFWGL